MPSLEHPPFDGLHKDHSLARYTAARLGGPADYLYIAKDPSYRDVKDLLERAWERDLPVTVIGGGANILVSDAGIRGLTIINRATHIGHEFGEETTRVAVSSGANLIRLARYCQERGLAGMEWAIAVPGTVGGAVVNNAGAHGSDIATLLKRVEGYEAEIGERWYSVDELDYAYRYSDLKRRNERKFFVLSAEFELGRDDPGRILQRMDHNNDYRRRSQPPGASLGSIFKNPPGDYAGRIIEAAGLKGVEVGAVQVSPIHANFLVNLGDDATARDYLLLIQLVKNRVKEVFGLALELEIQVLGEWD